MTEDTNVQDTSEDSAIPDELTTLKARANQIGLKFHPSIGVDALKAKLNEALGENLNTVNRAPQQRQYLTHEEYTRLTAKDKKKRANSLVRINVINMNPNKKEWEGEIISVGSAKLGTYKKYVLFGTSDGYHVPHIIYEAMKDRKCSVFHTVKDHLGKKVRKAKQINEFAIEVLPSLTKEELKSLAQRQSMAGSLTAE